MQQSVLHLDTSSENRYYELDRYIDECSEGRGVFLVCGNNSLKQEVSKHIINSKTYKVTVFSDFSPNPSYDSVCGGKKAFCESEAKLIIVIGGGSAIDVAKCIKMFSPMSGEGEDGSFLKREIKDNSVRLVAIPTTAGTGSEATKFAVIYYKGEKISVSDESCIPNAVMFDPSTLINLPQYHRRASMMDALGHAIESYWSVNSTDESKVYSHMAIQSIMNCMDEYLDNTENGNIKMLAAANLAGKAINIARTTAGHALCYKLTTMYGYAHGHSVTLCLDALWPIMLAKKADSIDQRGCKYFERILEQISVAFGTIGAREGYKKYHSVVQRMGFEKPFISKEDMEILKKGVNVERLTNNPVSLDWEQIEQIYGNIGQEK